MSSSTSKYFSNLQIEMLMIRWNRYCIYIYSHVIFLYSVNKSTTNNQQFYHTESPSFPKPVPPRSSKQHNQKEDFTSSIKTACDAYGCFLKWWYPQNTPKWWFLVGTPTVVGYHHFGKPPYRESDISSCTTVQLLVVQELVPQLSMATWIQIRLKYALALLETRATFWILSTHVHETCTSSSRKK